MKIKGGILKENLSFSSYILIVGILIVVPVLFYVSVSDYTVLKDNFQNNYYQIQNNTEDSIIESIKIVNTGLEIYDETFDNKLKDAFVPFIEAYNKSGGNPANIDLYTLKEQYGPEYDLYIIDRDHIVRYSTKKIEIGLNFSTYKEFSNYLDEITGDGKYSGDRIVRGTKDISSVSKYGYYPSPDGEYILELSYNIEDYSDIRNRLKYRMATDTIKEMNPYLLSVKIYDIYGLAIGDPDIPDKETKKFIVDGVIEQKSDYINYDTKNNTITRYRYADLSNPDFGSDMSVVLAFTYSNAAIEKELNKILFSKVISFFLVMILLMVVFYLATDIVTRPIKNLVSDVDEIAKGNLEHKIRIHGGREFLSLRESVDNLVIHLKIMIDNLRESENTIKKYNEELEDIIEKRTEELNEANREANFYLDLMTHDINNANMAALGYAQFIEETSDKSTQELVKKLISSISHSTDIISNVSLIRAIQRKNTNLKPVSLDAMIKKEIEHNPDMNIKYKDSGYFVLADELLGEVFSNITENSKKYAGTDCKIEITAEEKDGEIIVCIDDNGPGIAQDAKEDVFNRLFREKNKSGRNGKGLGLYIVKNLVEKRYGGTVSASDRVADNPGMGLRICITLKKA
ncbi:MAG: ATP-binding protein [Methanomicrobium sp.]|nr:ATP-binding protein [Methanomicrobium sp.]